MPTEAENPAAEEEEPVETPAESPEKSGDEKEDQNNRTDNEKETTKSEAKSDVNSDTKELSVDDKETAVEPELKTVAVSAAAILAILLICGGAKAVLFANELF